MKHILSDEKNKQIWTEYTNIITTFFRKCDVKNTSINFNIIKRNLSIQQECENAIHEMVKKYDEHYLVYYVLGSFYGEMGNYNVANACYKICVSKFPLPDAFLNMAIIQYNCWKNDIAKDILNDCLKHNPNELRALTFLGALCYVEKDYFGAIKINEMCIQQNPDTISPSMKNIFNNIGFSYSAIGKCKKALSYFDKGLNMDCDAHNDVEKIDLQLLQNKLINYDYLYDHQENVFLEFLKVNKILHTINICDKHLNKNKSKINIGYVSPDLRHHVCAFFINTILKFYDRNIFNVYCYANVAIEDDMSEKFKKYDGIKWFNIYEMSQLDICDLIRSHDIDVLIDLAGHTNGNSLNVFSKKPAPIQITYLGYPNTTGLTSMDYRITDRYADPQTTQQKFTETLIYMPRCFICYSINPIDLVPVIPTKHHFITFGVFNKMNKHNKYAFKTWFEIIKNVPNSVLLIKRDTKIDYDIKIKTLKKIGFKDEQLKIIDHISDSISYKKLYNDIDICLDTFPYSGTTTSCDGFLMSTPIITLGIPNRHVSNVTSSLLINMGFPELVTHTMDDYISVAIKLANDSDKIMYYKKNIRNQFIDLMNEQKFAKEFDSLLYNTFINHNGD